MEISRFGPDDADRLAAYIEVVNAVRAVDSPWQHPRPCSAEPRAGSATAGTARSRRRTSGSSTASPWRSGGWPPPSTTTCTWPGWGCRSIPSTGVAGHGTRMLEELVERGPGPGPDVDRHRRLGRRVRAGLRCPARPRAEERGDQPPPARWPSWTGSPSSGCTPRRSAAAADYEIVRRESARTPDDELEAAGRDGEPRSTTPPPTTSTSRTRSSQPSGCAPTRPASWPVASACSGSSPGTARPASWRATRSCSSTGSDPQLGRPARHVGRAQPPRPPARRCCSRPT